MRIFDIVWDLCLMRSSNNAYKMRVVINHRSSLMYKSGEWFVLQALNSIRHRMPSMLAIETAAACGKSSAFESSEQHVSNSMMVSVPIAVNGHMEIIDDAGCTARILRGQVWMTTEGRREDAIADQGQKLVFERGCRALLTAFRDAVVVISAPKHIDVRFLLHRNDGKSVLTVASAGVRTIGQLARWLATGVVQLARS